MQIASWLCALSRVAVVGVIAVATLILQGCGGEDEVSREGASGASSGDAKAPATLLDAEVLAAQKKLYAAVDAKYPNGMPPVEGVEVRSADAEYQAKIQEAIRQQQPLLAAQRVAQQEVDAFQATIRENLRKRMGVEPNEVIVADALAKNAHYQSLLATLEEANAAVEAARVANSALIRERRMRKINDYTNLKAAADAAAREAGVPVRADGSAAGSLQEPASEATAQGVPEASDATASPALQP